MFTSGFVTLLTLLVVQTGNCCGEFGDLGIEKFFWVFKSLHDNVLFLWEYVCGREDSVFTLRSCTLLIACARSDVVSRGDGGLDPLGEG